jgi:hypothetical protein
MMGFLNSSFEVDFMFASIFDVFPSLTGFAKKAI